MLDAECLYFDILDRPSIGRQSVHLYFEQVEVFRSPPGKLVAGMQPFEEPMEFADVTGAVFVTDCCGSWFDFLDFGLAGLGVGNVQMYISLVEDGSGARGV